jgi:hypothetical protein
VEGQVPARIRISLQEGTIEISGSEQFVENHIGHYQDLIVRRFEEIPRSYAKPNPDLAREYSPKSSEDGSTGVEDRPADDLEAYESRPADDLETYEHIYTI